MSAGKMTSNDVKRTQRLVSAQPILETSPTYENLHSARQAGGLPAQRSMSTSSSDALAASKKKPKPAPKPLTKTVAAAKAMYLQQTGLTPPASSGLPKTTGKVVGGKSKATSKNGNGIIVGDKSQEMSSGKVIETRKPISNSAEESTYDVANPVRLNGVGKPGEIPGKKGSPAVQVGVEEPFYDEALVANPVAVATNANQNRRPTSETKGSLQRSKAVDQLEPIYDAAVTVDVGKYKRIKPYISDATTKKSASLEYCPVYEEASTVNPNYLPAKEKLKQTLSNGNSKVPEDPIYEEAAVVVQERLEEKREFRAPKKKKVPTATLR